MSEQSPLVLPNPLHRQWLEIEADVLAAVQRVGKKGSYILGEEVTSFEDELARMSGRAHAVGCASGLDAIELALQAAELPAGGKVLTTPLSAFATTLAILRARLVPVFCDVDDDGQLDLEAARRILEDGEGFVGIVHVHLYGTCTQMEVLRELKTRFELFVVEDAAQAVLAQDEHARVGDVGNATSLSFYPTKNLGGLGDGGAVLTDDEALANRLRALRNYGQTRTYEHEMLGMNSRLDELHAAILRTAYLPRLLEWTRQRRAIAARYRAGIENRAIRLPKRVPAGAVHHLFPCFTERGHRDAFISHLRDHGVVAGIHYPKPIPSQRALLGQPHEIVGTLPRVKLLTSAEVSLPIHPFLTDDETNLVVDVVNAWSPV